MKTHKNKVGRKTREANREKYVAGLKAEISSLKKDKKKLNTRLKEKGRYIEKIHNFIGTKKIKEFKKSSLFHGGTNGK